MIRILESKTTDTVGKYWYYLICDEGDTKPTSEFPADSGKIIANGSRLFETGTEIRYEYNNGSWTAVGQVDVPEPVFENKTVTPTTSEQTITADEGYDALGTVTVEAVTSAIDANITAGNIKNGVSILGVEGNINPVEFSTEPAAFGLVKNITNLNADIPNGITSIIDYAFNACTGLTSVKIPSSVTSIGSNAFVSCTGLTDVIISNGVISIKEKAFAGCSGLTSIEIPSSVGSIGTNAFQNCTNLTTITIHKPEGSISGASWGASNATVIWDGE